MAAAALHGTDLFGDPIEPKKPNKLSDDFGVPPFSELNAREGWWQQQRRAWLALGIRGEVGRDAKSYNIGDWLVAKEGAAKGNADGVSVFDPVLCEMAYRWFCPPGGQVVDPFAGGSVRGVVAAMTGRRYWGCDLRPEQVAANREQQAAICPETAGVPINVSGASLRQLFHPCEPDYISNVCHAACGCRGSSSGPAKRLGGICVTVHPSEADRLVQLGGTIRDGFLAPTDDGRCPFNDRRTSLCTIHDRGKPFGCAASPFTLNGGDTLIVRNRYRLLRCYRAEGAVPAYDAHRFALEAIFGRAEAARLAAAAAAGDDRIPAALPPDVYARLKDNDDAKHDDPSVRARPALEWSVGDARDALDDAPDADFVFSCPPYFDLERYSDDPRDLSAMAWPDFADAYRAIVAKACGRLRDDRFAAFVVGDVRDKDGCYRGLPELTVDAFAAAGLRKYNEAVLLTPVGSTPIRVGKQFTASRKLGKTHQNVLVFVKGCPRKASRAIPLSERAVG